MHKIKIAKRALSTPASPIRKLHFYVQEAERRGIKVYNLNIGQPDIPAPQEFFDSIRKFNRPVIAYAPSQGYTEVISAWQDYYKSVGIELSQEEIIVTTGASEAINFALAAVTEPNDEVIVFEPLYPNYITLARMVGIRLTPVTLSSNDNYHLPTRKQIEKRISPKVKAIIVNNPSNPAGSLLTRAELRLIAEIARENNLFIIADETYREFIYTEKQFVSMTDFPAIGQNVILVDSVSKRFCLCGARIGCLASKNKEVMSVALKFAQGRLSSPTLEQLAVIPLLKNHLAITQRVVQEYRKRREIISKFIHETLGARAYIPEGAFYALLPLPVADTEIFCRWLLEKFNDHNETVLLAPGEGFYISKNKGRDEVRIAYVVDEKKLTRSFEIITKALKKYKKSAHHEKK